MGSIDRDDPVERLVDLAVQAQTRMMLAYMGAMQERLTNELKGLVRGEFGGEQVHFRKCDDDRHKERDEAIRKDAMPVALGGAGMSIRALARKYHLSKTQVARILLKDGTGDEKNGNCATARKGGE